MATKVQFNPSTLKASYVAANSKAQSMQTTISSVCEHCTDVQPSWFNVDLSNFIDVSCCDRVSESNKASGVAAAVAGSYHIQYNSGCVYETIFSGSYGTILRYSDRECTNFISSGVCDRLKITLTVTATGIDIAIRVYAVGGSENHLFDGSITFSGEENCNSVDETATNDIEDCEIPINGTGFVPCSSSGAVRVYTS